MSEIILYNNGCPKCNVLKDKLKAKIILYSNGCPKCKVLKAKLEAKNITFTESDNLEELVSMGIQSLPVLNVDGMFLNFVQANDWVNSQPSYNHLKQEN